MSETRGGLVPQRTVDGPYGPMRISCSGGPSPAARVDGPGIPTVAVFGGTVEADGQRAPAHQAGDRDPRRKARTRTAHIGGHRYELRPTSLRHARFTRDAVPVAEGHATLRAYNPFRSFLDIDAHMAWTPEATPLDVALGQAMAVVFGAGSFGLLGNIGVIGLGMILDW